MTRVTIRSSLVAIAMIATASAVPSPALASARSHEVSTTARHELDPRSSQGSAPRDADSLSVLRLSAPDLRTALIVGRRLAIADSCVHARVAPAPSIAAASFMSASPDASNRPPSWEPAPAIPILGGIGGVTMLFAMAALGAPRDTKRRSGVDLSLGAKAATLIYQGALVVSDGGVAAPGRTAVGLVALGRARETVDNTDGGAGDLDVPIERGVFDFENSGDSITAAHIGRVCYIVDDQTVHLTSGGGTRSVAGVIVDIDPSGRVWVRVDGLVLLANSVDGSAVANSGNADTVGAIPEIFRIDIADASADTDVVVAHKIRVLRFEFHNTGLAAHAANDTVQLRNAANPITDAVAKTAAVNKKVEASSYDPAYHEIAAGGTLRVHAVHDTNVAGIAIVTAVRVA